MSELDVINAFLDGEQMRELPLSTDGRQLYFGKTLVAERREGGVHIAAQPVGAAESRHAELLLDVVEWRKQRDKVLRSLLSGKGAPAWARAGERQGASFGAGLTFAMRSVHENHSRSTGESHC